MDLKIALDIGFGPRRDLDSGGVEQQRADGDEHHGEHVTGEGWQCRPRKGVQGRCFPRQGETGRRLRIEHPAARLRRADRRAAQQQDEVHGRERCQQHAGQREWAFRAAQQPMQDDGDGRSRRELGAGHGADEGAEIGQRRMLVGDDLDGAGDHQPAGGAEEAADHRIGQKADGAAGMGEAQHAHQEPGQRRRQRHGDDGRRQQVGVAAGGDPLQHRGDEGGNDDGDRAVRPGDRERQRAAQCHKGSAQGSGHERNRDAIRQKMRERPVENERRVGQRVGDRQHAADRAGEYVRQCGAHALAVFGLSNVLPVRPIISRPGRDLQHGPARG